MLWWSAMAMAWEARFDAFEEGFFASELTEDGIRFHDLDQRMDGNPAVNIEDASASLAGLSGFSSPNVLGFGGYAPGPAAAFAEPPTDAPADTDRPAHDEVAEDTDDALPAPAPTGCATGGADPTGWALTVILATALRRRSLAHAR